MTPRPGTVYLVGAGPGDPGLITVKGLRRLREADVIVYDRLVEPALLGEARKGAEIIYAGKEPGPVGTHQEDIYPMLLDRAREGKRVVRLKGGDPFVFGRGGEEAQVLAMAGIPFEVVPGVTSAVAAPAYAGIPLTHREAASSFTVVSAVEDPGKSRSSINWEALAHTGGTLVVMMGWGALERVVAALVDNGMKRNTPVALVQRGTWPSQKTVTGTLKDIVRKGQEAELGPPLVVVVGDAVKLRRDISWMEEKPLFGLRVLVTRSRSQASVLSGLLADEGAESVEVPTIEIAPPDDLTELDQAISGLSKIDWLVFTSVNGVDGFFSRLRTLGLDSRALGRCKVCAVGLATALALEGNGLRPDLLPGTYTTEAVAEEMARAGVTGRRVLLPRSDIAPEQLAHTLAGHGAQVRQCVAYRTLTPQGSRETARKALTGGRIDVATFTSSSTVRNLVGLLDGESGLLEAPLVACIGPVTAAATRELGVRVDLVATQHTVPGLVEALKKHYFDRRGD